LFTDGMANKGLTKISELVALARPAAHATRDDHVALGFGASFNEELMRDMSRPAAGTTGTSRPPIR